MLTKWANRNSLRFPGHNWRTYRLLFAGGYAALLLLLLAVALSGLWLLSGVRAYVEGEGFWSKAQKDSVSYLRRYSRSRSESDYQRYLAELSVPLADHAARMEMLKTRPDFRAAAGAFIRGRNHPDDAPVLVWLFRYFHSETHLRRAIAIWTQGDEDIEELRALAESLHNAVRSDVASQASVDLLLSQIENVNDRLTPLENDFSQTLGAGARFAQRSVLIALFSLTAALIGIGAMISGRLLRRIRFADAQYRQFLATARDGIFVTDQRTGVILEVNHSAEEMAGLSCNELRGLRLQDLIQPCGTAINSALSAVKSPQDSVMRGLEGREVRVDVRASTARLHDVAVVVSIVRDVTEQRLFQERSAEAARMEALGRLAAGIAHDFNNLLAGIMISASDALAFAGTTMVREALEQVLRAARNGADLVQHLMAFSRNQQLAPEVFDVNQAICSVVPFLNRLLGAGVELSTVLAPVGLPVKADRSRFEQVLINLAANGRDAMPLGGILTLQTSEVRNVDLADLGRPAPFPGGGVLIKISDEGNGMPPEVQKRAFDPFFTTKPLGRGAGLGLASVFGTVRQSGGDVWMSSVAGVGTTVSVLLPIVTND